MAIPGFTAEAALYPTANHYRIVGPGVSGPAHGVTADALQTPLRSQSRGMDKAAGLLLLHCHQSCYDRTNECLAPCDLMTDPGEWTTICKDDCDQTFWFCLQVCDWMYGLGSAAP
jgi:hypothetical protein